MPSARDTALPQGTLAAQSNSQTDVPLLKMEGITKRFGENTALSRVDFDIRAGEIHALLGENGAGKSTLMHVLSGLLRSDSGSIMLNGSSVRIASPQVARKNGIAMVHQHFALVPAFTVAENLALDTEPYFGKRFSLTESSRPALERAHALGWNLDPSARVSSLPVGTQQRIEIVKALATNAKLLIFDEPTAVLSPNEVEGLFTVLRRLRDEGNGVILIAHKLAEIMAVADRVTILRRGVRVASAQISDTNPEQLAEWMIGEKPTPVLPEKTVSASTPSESGEESPQDRMRAVFQASRISVLGDRGETAIQDLNLELHAGEIYGVAGVDGNGQAELAEALTGLRPLKSGT
ncbi:MAG: ATP-binding cassette domain-containing protein, partial [Armatimonadetes bacterium]|nr:ATP-binding cassette domain-containing protein [Armatimonadota bacterium]